MINRIRAFLILFPALATACAHQNIPGRPPAIGKIGNVVLIGWDGAQRERTKRMLADSKLPNLQRLIEAGSWADTQVTSGSTETKPGWAEILSGHNADLMGIETNKEYRPIPDGYTLFELLKSRFGNGITTIFVGGKTTNIGRRGPHELCINCVTRDPKTWQDTLYWDKERNVGRTWHNEPQRWVLREGEPFFYSAKRIDFYENALGGAENVGKEALTVMERYQGRPFFAFFHFQEPDEEGHLHGEGSKEYSDAISAADLWLGRIVAKLKELHLDDRTVLFVVTDHGMDRGGNNHQYAPETFAATNSSRRLHAGDRKDIAPTILESFHIDPARVVPRLDGASLFSN